MGSWLSSFSLGKKFSNEEELKGTFMKHGVIKHGLKTMN